MTGPHTVDIFRAYGHGRGAHVAVCTTDGCGWSPDVIHPTARAALIAARGHSIDHARSAAA